MANLAAAALAATQQLRRRLEMMPNITYAVPVQSYDARRSSMIAAETCIALIVVAVIIACIYTCRKRGEEAEDADNAPKRASADAAEAPAKAAKGKQASEWH